MDPGRALRHHRLPPRRLGLRDHHPPGRGLRPGVPQARGPLRRRGRGRPAAGGTSRSTPWRWRLPEPRLIDPFGGADDLAARPSPHPAVARRSRSPTTRCGCCGPPASSPATGSTPSPSWSPRCSAMADRLDDRLGRAHPRRVRQADGGRRPERRAVVPGRHGPDGPLPPGVRGHAPRAGPDPPPQGRADPHDRGGGQDPPGAPRPPRRALPRRRQAPDPLVRGRRGLVPPPRGGGRPHDPGADEGAEVLRRRHRGRDPAGLPPPAVPHLQDGVDRRRGPAVRPRRRAAAPRADRAHPLRLHHPQRAQGPGAVAPHGRARGRASPTCRPARSWPPSGPTSTATR